MTKKQSVKPPPDNSRICQQCGLYLPERKPGAGRPAKYCSPTCRQHAYEDRRGIPHFRERYNFDDCHTSEVVEAMDDAAYADNGWRKRRVVPVAPMPDPRHVHPTVGHCMAAVIDHDEAMAAVVNYVSELVRNGRREVKGNRIVAHAVAELVDALQRQSGKERSSEVFRRAELTSGWPTAFVKESKGGPQQ